MDLQRGMRDKLEKYVNTNGVLDIKMSIDGADKYDFCCFGVDSADSLTDSRYIVFRNQKSSPISEIQYSSSGNSAVFSVNLSLLPANISKLVFTASIDGDSAMGNITSHTFSLSQNGTDAVRFYMTGNEFEKEKAIITVEIYRKDGWRINAVARGFNGGLGDLLKSYGGKEVTLPPPQPEATAMPAKVDLKKGQKVSLVKGSNGLGEISINLNWKQPVGFNAKPIDLDLGCLYELKNGTKGTVQALGKRFGSLTNPPYIALDGDDRSGSSAEGENLRINGSMVSEIKRILIYTFIYEGIANWAGADGVVTVKCPGSPEITVRMDEYGSSLGFCAIALLENVNDTFSVQKIVNFYKDHTYADRAFGWGLKWAKGKKD
ncbi:MAG: TerD family protein [Ruminococcus flavefaciens]|nr:TerD family protein [Ruminococcus flavefaciens]MCM1231069.1 TerD family protein [Ruminococcus flavefaciens]